MCDAIRLPDGSGCNKHDERESKTKHFHDLRYLPPCSSQKKPRALPDVSPNARTPLRMGFPREKMLATDFYLHASDFTFLYKVLTKYGPTCSKLSIPLRPFPSEGVYLDDAYGSPHSLRRQFAAAPARSHRHSAESGVRCLDRRRRERCGVPGNVIELRRNGAGPGFVAG